MGTYRRLLKTIAVRAIAPELYSIAGHMTLPTFGRTLVRDFALFVQRIPFCGFFLGPNDVHLFPAARIFLQRIPFCGFFAHKVRTKKAG